MTQKKAVPLHRISKQKKYMRRYYIINHLNYTKMKKTFIKQISLFLMITCCGFSFTSCSSKSSDTASEDVSLPNRIVSVNNDDLFRQIDESDIPLIEDDFSLLLAEVHNDALVYFFDRLETMDFTLFSQTEAENDSMIMELARQYAHECAVSYCVDTSGFYLFNDISETEARQYLEQNASAKLLQYIQAVDDICNTDHFNNLSNLYGTYGELTDDKERLLLKSCIAVAQNSYYYWTYTNLDATSLWPEDIMTQYQNPENPALFGDAPLSIKWNQVARADYEGAKEGLIWGVAEQVVALVITGGWSWTELGIVVGVHAAVSSFKAYKKLSESCTIEAINTDHSYMNTDNNSLYFYFHDKYNRYGADYFMNNWGGRFSFMVSNF